MSNLTRSQRSKKNLEEINNPIRTYWYVILVVVLTLFSTPNLKADRHEGLEEPKEFETLEEIWDSLPKPTRIDPNVTTFVHGMGFGIPPEPVTYQIDQKHQHDTWKRTLKQCAPVSTKSALSTECVAALSEYFQEEPIWKYSRLYYYSDRMGLLNSTYNEINRRHYKLPYGFDDYSIEQVPTWGDIFDGRLEQRAALFSRVSQDPQCLELSSFADAGIQEDKAEQCSAPEMYKYAAYLDACSAALQRLAVLTSPTRSSKDKYWGLDRFEVSKLLILEKIESAAGRDFAQESVEKGLLHASWVIKQCTVNPFLLQTAQRNSRTSPLDFAWQIKSVGNEELTQLIKRTHNVALRIAAKSGDERAIRSLPRLYGAITSDLLKRHPLLVHRHLASNTGGISEELDWHEQRRHRAKAYLLLKELAGPEIAQDEYDPSKLQVEIDYVLSGGDLRLPRWSHEILID